MSSSKLNTKDIKTGGGGGSKTLTPGNQQCKIQGVELQEFMLKPGSYYMVLHMEGSDLGKDFEGFWINKDDESLGRHKGQVGRVKASEWAFADSTTKTGIEISRNTEILKFIKSLCTALGTVKWLDDQNDKHNTIEELVAAFNSEQPFKDKLLNYCIGGKEWKDKKGYIQYDLFLPKFTKGGFPFESTTDKPSKLIKYNEVDHLRKAKVSDVTEFGSAESELNEESKEDFHL